MSVGSIGADAIVFIYQIRNCVASCLHLSDNCIASCCYHSRYLNFTRCFEVEWSHLSCMMWNMDTLGKVKSIVGIL